MTDTQPISRKELEDKLQILEEENIRLAEQAEAILLLSLVAESVAGLDDPAELVDHVLERIAILKDIPYVACAQYAEHQVQIEAAYSLFVAQAPPPANIHLPKEILQRIDHSEFGIILPIQPGKRTVFAIELHEFHPKVLALFPFVLRNGLQKIILCVFEEDNIPHAAQLQMLMKRIVEVLSTRMDNIYLLRELQQLNDELDRKVNSRTLKIQRQFNQLQALQEITRLGVETNQEDDLLEKATTVIGNTFYPDHFGVLLVDEEGQCLRVHRSYHGLLERDQQRKISFGEGVSGHVARTRQSVRIADVQQEEKYIASTPGIQSELCVPILSGDRVLGVINAESTQKDFFSLDDQRFLSTLAGHFGTVLERVRLLEATQRQAHELSALYHMALETTKELDQDSLIHSIEEQVTTLLHPDTIALALFDPISSEFEVVLAVEESQIVKEFLHQRFSLDQGGLTGWVLKERKPLLIDDLLNDPSPVPPKHGVKPARSWAGVPLIAGDQLVGVLSVQSFTPGAFDQEHFRFLHSLAAQVAIVLENTRLFASEHRRVEETEALLATSQALSSLTLDDVLKTISEKAKIVFAADGFRLHLIDPNGQDLRCVVALHQQAETIQAFSLKITQGVTGRVARSGMPELIANIQDDPDVVHVPGTQPGPEALALIPLRIREQVIGVMTITRSDTERIFTPLDLPMLTAFANQSAVAIENARLFQETSRRADEMAAVAYLSGVLRKAQSMEEMFPLLLQKTCQLIHANAAALFLMEPEDGRLVARGWYPANPAMMGKYYLQDEGIAGRVAATGEMYYIGDLDADDLEQLLPGEASHWQHTHSSMAFPLNIQTRTIGVMRIGLPEKRAFTEEEKRLLTALMDIAANAIQRADLHEQTENRLRQVQLLRMIDQAIISSMDLSVTLHIVLTQMSAHLNVDASSIMLVRPNEQRLYFSAGVGFRSQRMNQFVRRIDRGIAGQIISERRMIKELHVSQNRDPYMQSLLFDGEGFETYVGLPLISRGQVKGILEVFNRSPIKPRQDWFEFLKTVANQAAIAVDNALLFNDLQHSNADLRLAYDSTLEGWAQMLELRDQETEGHTRRVADLTVQLARTMGVNESGLVQIRRGALLHDIGKMGVPDEILRKTGPLNDDEQIVMRRHPKWAFDVLNSISYLAPALDIPYCHHEKWDGSGYPRGLRGKEIPLAARIFAVIDVWDALISTRPYRQAWSKEKTLAYILEESGHYFDPEVVAAFMQLVERERL